MSNFKIFDGTNWLDPCDCNISILDVDGISYQQINPNNCIVSYFDGTNWCPITCPCECPAGYTFNPATNSCETPGSTVPAIPSGGTTYDIIEGNTTLAYGQFGARLYEDITTKQFPIVGFKPSAYEIRENSGTGALITIDTAITTGSDIFVAQGSTVKGRLNRAGIWGEITGGATRWPDDIWFPVEFCVELTTAKTYIFAIAGDNQIRASIKSDTFNPLSQSGAGPWTTNIVNLFACALANCSTGGSNPDPNENIGEPFRWWHMFPITLPAGSHVFILEGYNISGQYAFGAEIYDISTTDMIDWMTNTTPFPTLSDPPKNDNIPAFEQTILFTTKSLVQTPPLLVPGPSQTITWSCPPNGVLDLCNGSPQCIVPGDSIPCGQGQAITSTTEINIWFDNSGSMNSTLSPLQIMQSTLLQTCLLPIYNNDVTLYNERVKVLNMLNGSAWNYNERFVRCLATERNFNRAVDTTVNQVINLTFADESDVYGYPDNTPFNNSSRTSGYDADIAYLRNIMSTVAYTIKGTAFRVNTGPNSFTGFRGLTQATFVNNGAYSVPNNVSDYYTINFNCNLDTLAGSTPTYYRDQIVAALTALGISIPVCP
jgi:hypothetical protein